MSIGKNIKLLRKRAKLTQVQLGERIGRTESSIIKYEADAVEIPISVIKNIADVFEVNYIDLLECDNRTHNEIKTEDECKTDLVNAISEALDELAVEELKAIIGYIEVCMNN